MQACQGRSESIIVARQAPKASGSGERTFGCLGRWRRTSTDDAYVPATSTSIISLAMIRIMLRRLAES